MIRCPACGAENLPNTLFCEECGEPLMHGGKLSVRIVSLTEGWEVKLPIESEIIIGRADPSAGFRPHLDLSDRGGLEKGVSRRHLRLFRQGKRVYAEDLGSYNGSFINNSRLLPFAPQVIASGDELRLGGEILKIYLEEG
ncbi:MAG: FHA domain-containing protein [Anaerolineae bacterium]|nr:FHA domain-containing protein [Anaerolineae bacterium]MDW8101483.1 FHA domain-containing protein [Anaerolineae bacterium]